MKDPNLAILNAYLLALSGMTFGGTAVPVYSRLAPLTTVPKKYVLLNAQVKTQNETKCGYWYECVINCTIVTRYPNGVGDITFAMVIGEEIADRVQVNTLSLSNFSIRQTKQLPTTEVVLETATENIFQYIIPFYHKINRAA